MSFRPAVRWLPRLPRLARLLTRSLVLYVLLVGALWGVRPAAGQDAQAPDSTLYRVETTDGNVFIGRLVTEDDREVTLDTERLGTLTIARADIERMTAIEPDRLRNGEYWFENPQSTRYFFAPNAIGLPAGSGYYQNTWIFLNNVNVGVTRNFSIGAGTVPIFLLGASALPFWLLPKVSVSTPADNVHLAAGAVIGGILGEDGEGAGLVYGVTTLGTRDANLSIGVGYGYAGSEWSSTPALTLSGMVRVGRTLYLIAENYVFTGSEVAGVISAGLRWAPERFAVDFGLVRPLEEGGFIGIPWLGVTIPFGRR